MRIDLMDLFEDKFQDIHEDLWQYLSRTEKPIVLYGMGDGADKIIAHLERCGLHISGVFASDERASHKQFAGFAVCTFDFSAPGG